jgi:hypothetical protein
MVRFIPMFILMGVFAAIGIYWTILTEHFIAWTRKYNQSFHRFIDNRLAQPVMVERAKTNYARLEANGGLTMLTWGVRMVGVALAGVALTTIIRIALGI